MILLDVNILVYAFRAEMPDHASYLQVVSGLMSGATGYGISDLVLNGFIRVTTNRRIFKTPSPIEAALAFAEAIRDQPHCVPVEPGNRHWKIFTDLCRKVRAHGDTVADAYHAALAIESGSEWLSADRGFGRFPGLMWRHPLD